MHPDRAVKHMPTVDVYRQRLASLQGVWDSLSLLSNMSSDGTDLTKTREAFESLATELVKHLSAQTFRKSSRELHAKAQVAIDVMVRNLFERTADIGFLCADDDIRTYFENALANKAPDRTAERRMLQRLREYVDKYSVYENVVLLAPNGDVLLQLDDSTQLVRCEDPLVAETLKTTAGYVETYRRTDLVGGDRPALIYSYRVMSGGKAVGVLCLRFGFQGEVERILAKLRAVEDWTIFTWLDKRGTVIASSDPWQVPEGAMMPFAMEEEGRVVRFGGREYLAVTRRTAGYQGYMGPNWLGHALLPLEHAFEQSSSQRSATDDASVAAALGRSTEVFTEALRLVPEQADAIQRELNRSVWNGNVRLSSRNTEANSFAKALLREISTTGQKTKEVFERSIGDLHETVLSSILHDSHFKASLAVEIMDRNLYERANDCRWWALNGTLRDCLAGKAPAATAEAVLRDINRLYTVYDNLVLFDRDCKVVAVSNVNTENLVGSTLPQRWAQETVNLHSSQAYGVSAFEPSDIYAGRHTYVFTAAIRGLDGCGLGGIGIVFDSEPQFEAILRDVLPPPAEGTTQAVVAVLVDSHGRVISATSRYRPGDVLNLPPNVVAPRPEGISEVLALDGHYYAVGACRAGGYREFPGVGAAAVILMPIGAVQEQRQNAVARMHPASVLTDKDREHIDMATFFCAGQWFAVRASEVVEAIDNAAITRMPGRAPGCSGVVKHRNRIVPLLNLELLIEPGSVPKTDSIIVIAAPDQPWIGLQVELLGDVLEVPADHLTNVAEILGNVDTRLAGRLARPGDSHHPPFLVLEAAALTELMQPPQAEKLRA